MENQSDPQGQAGTPDAGQALQFDRVETETDTGQMACTGCSSRITVEYHRIDGRTVCGACRARMEEDLKKKPGVRGFMRAAAFGLGAAAAGSGIYYAISALTGYEFGLVAIVVGLMVGAAVKTGCYGYGGWLYQSLGILLTYAAIVSTYIPPVLEEMGKDTETRSVIQSGGAAYVILLVLVAVIACFAPFLAGFSNFMGWIIIGIGLYEAWKINRRRRVEITGPHIIAPPVEQEVVLSTSTAIP